MIATFLSHPLVKYTWRKNIDLNIIKEWFFSSNTALQISSVVIAILQSIQDTLYHFFHLTSRAKKGK